MAANRRSTRASAIKFAPIQCLFRPSLWSGARPVYRATMSALGHQRTLRHVRSISALPPETDIGGGGPQFRLMPKADIPVARRLGQAGLPIEAYACCAEILVK